MAAIAVQTVGAGGNGNVTFGASSTSDTVAPGGRAGGYELDPILLIIINADDATHTVTVGGGSAVSVLAGDTAVIPVYSEGVGDASVTVVTDDATTQTVAAIRLTGE